MKYNNEIKCLCLKYNIFSERERKSIPRTRSLMKILHNAWYTSSLIIIRCWNHLFMHTCSHACFFRLLKYSHTFFNLKQDYFKTDYPNEPPFQLFCTKFLIFFLTNDSKIHWTTHTYSHIFITVEIVNRLWLKINNFFKTINSKITKNVDFGLQLVKI